MGYDNQFPGFEEDAADEAGVVEQGVDKEERFNQFMSHDFSEKKGRDPEDDGNVDNKNLTRASQRDGGNMKKMGKRIQYGVLVAVAVVAGLFIFRDHIFPQRAPAPNPYAFSQQTQQFAAQVPVPSQPASQPYSAQQAQTYAGAPIPEQQPAAPMQRVAQQAPEHQPQASMTVMKGAEVRKSVSEAPGATEVSEDSLKKFQEIVAAENQKVIDGITLMNSTTCSTDGSKEQGEEIQTLQAKIKKLNGQIAHVRNLERKHRHELEDFKKKVAEEKQKAVLQAEQAAREVRAAVETPSPSNEKLKDWRLLGMNSDMCVFQSPEGVKKLYRKGDSLEENVVVMAIYPTDQMVRTSVGLVHLTKK